MLLRRFLLRQKLVGVSVVGIRVIDAVVRRALHLPETKVAERVAHCFVFALH